MPLIQAEDKRKEERAQIKLHPDVLADLNLYCRFAEGSSQSHVTMHALKRLFTADHEFTKYKAENSGAVQIETKKRSKKVTKSEPESIAV